MAERWTSFSNMTTLRRYIVQCARVCINSDGCSNAPVHWGITTLEEFDKNESVWRSRMQANSGILYAAPAD